MSKDNMNRKLRILIGTGAIAAAFGIAQQIITQKGYSIGYLIGSAIGSATTLMLFGFLVSVVVKLFLKLFKVSFSRTRFSWSVLIIAVLSGIVSLIGTSYRTQNSADYQQIEVSKLTNDKNMVRSLGFLYRLDIPKGWETKKPRGKHVDFLAVDKNGSSVTIVVRPFPGIPKTHTYDN